jgi:hypothetical protein
VTSLGRFLPLGKVCFLLHKNPKFVFYEFHGKSYALTLGKNEFGYILGDYF